MASVWRSGAFTRVAGSLFGGARRELAVTRTRPRVVRNLESKDGTSPPFPQTGSPESFERVPSLPRDDIENRVFKVVSEFPKTRKDKVSMNAHFEEELGLDSLDSVELVIALEDEFEITIPDADAEKIKTCAEAINYIDELEIRDIL